MTKKESDSKKYRLLPPKIAETDPWVKICVDLVDPFTIMTSDKTNSLFALTMIDPATNWFKIVEAMYKIASTTSIQDLFHNTWLARYLRPQFIVFDNGSKLKRERTTKEFKYEFKQMSDNLWH
jgi:hypothetical protein